MMIPDTMHYQVALKTLPATDVWLLLNNCSETLQNGFQSANQ